MLGMAARAGVGLRLPEGLEGVPVGHVRRNEFVAGAEIVAGVGDDLVEHPPQRRRFGADGIADAGTQGKRPGAGLDEAGAVGGVLD